VKLPCILIVLLSFVSVSFAFAANPVPYVNQPLVPASVALGSSAFTLTVNGTGFVSGAVVNWNGSARTTTFVSSSQAKASITSADIASATTAAVTVRNPTPGGGPSNTVYFTVTPTTASVTFSRKGAAHGQLPLTTVSADFNGDGNLDLAVTLGFTDLFQAKGNVGILLGNGDGTFQTPVNYRVPENPAGLVAGDFNGDGKVDLAVGSGLGTGKAAVSVLIGNGDGTFQPRVIYPTGKLPIGITPVLAIDANRDGKLDLVFPVNGFLATYLGNGDGTFAAPLFSSSPDSFGAESVTVGDFNDDGVLDVAFPAVVQFGNGDGTFGAATSLSGGGIVSAFVAGDFNGDGKLDIAGAGAGSDTVYLGNGDGTFQSGITTTDDGGGVSAISTAALNGDSVLDIVVSHYGTSTVTYSLGNGDGTFGPYTALVLGGPEQSAVADFNKDGKLDFALADYQAGSGVYVYLQGP